MEISNINSEECVLQKNKFGDYDYVRINSKELLNLSLKFKEFYGYKALILSSGNHAINIMLRYILNKYNNKKINFIFPSELYSDTSKHIFELQKIYNFSYNIFDISNQDIELTDIANKLYKSNTIDKNIIFAESCSNPNGYCINYENLQKFKLKISNTLIIIDNTWLTYLLSNPLEYNCIDYVVLSLTKYYTGSTIISGAIIPKNDFNDILNLVKLEGIHICPIICNKINSSFSEMPIRLQNASNNTIKILDVLKNYTSILICHPFLFSKKFKNGLYLSVFTITVNNCIKEKLINKVKNNNINYKTSFGGPDTRIDPYPKLNFDGSITFRISIGYLTDIIYDEHKITTLISQLI
jgi:cystathionine beta-lyase/cystathionine gamma-synthase